VDELESLDVVRAFAAQYDLQGTILMDEAGAAGLAYKLYSTPTVYFVDAQGVIVDIAVGEISADWLIENVEKHSN